MYGFHLENHEEEIRKITEEKKAAEGIIMQLCVIINATIGMHVVIDTYSTPNFMIYVVVIHLTIKVLPHLPRAGRSITRLKLCPQVEAFVFYYNYAYIYICVQVPRVKVDHR